ncbi:MAG TPA: hypothetical protein VMM18_05165 [Gemmatimonadaceae bacterium]|nr:hypothetical protein [Gemmatimonadaceae bacterium]
MKIARLIALSLSLVLGGAVVAHAQQGPPGGGRGGMGGNPGRMLMQNITLTAEQQVRVDSISAKYQAEMTAMRQGGGGGMSDEARQRMMESRTKLQADLRAVLTAEQQKVFDENAAAMASRMQRRPPPARR